MDESAEHALDSPGQPQLEQSTEPAERPAVAPETPDALTVAEVVQQFVTSEKTVRRWLSDGKLPGAFQVAGPFGQEWRVPVQSLVAKGFRLRDQAGAGDTQATQTAAASGELVQELRRQRDHLEQQVERLTGQLDQRQKVLEERTGKEAELQRELGRLEAERDGLQAQLEQATRRWWRRKRKPKQDN